MGASKHDRERPHLLLFRDLCPHLPAGTLSQDDAPDAIVYDPDGSPVVGVEVVEMFVHPDITPPPQAQESLEDLIVRAAELAYFAATGSSLDVTIFFQMTLRLSKRAAPALGKTIGDFIAKNLPAGEDGLSDDWTTEDCPHGVNQILVHRTGKGIWQASRCGPVIDLGEEAIQKSIDGKNLKAPAYRTRCRELWLLVVVDNCAPSSFGEVAQDACGHVFQSLFDRTFVLNYGLRQLVELKTRPAHP